MRVDSDFVVWYGDYMNEQNPDGSLGQEGAGAPAASDGFPQDAPGTLDEAGKMMDNADGAYPEPKSRDPQRDVGRQRAAAAAAQGQEQAPTETQPQPAADGGQQRDQGAGGSPYPAREESPGWQEQQIKEQQQADQPGAEEQERIEKMESDLAYYRKKDEMNDFVRDNQVPSDIETRMRKYLMDGTVQDSNSAYKMALGEIQMEQGADVPPQAQGRPATGTPFAGAGGAQGTGAGAPKVDEDGNDIPPTGEEIKKGLDEMTPAQRQQYGDRALKEEVAAGESISFGN